MPGWQNVASEKQSRRRRTETSFSIGERERTTPIWGHEFIMFKPTQVAAGTEVRRRQQR